MAQLVRAVGRVLEAAGRHVASCPTRGHGISEAASVGRAALATVFSRIRRPTRVLSRDAASPANQLRRMSACYNALDGFDLVGIEQGSIKEVFDASLLLTSEAESVLKWVGTHVGSPLHHGMKTRLTDAC